MDSISFAMIARDVKTVKVSPSLGFLVVPMCQLKKNQYNLSAYGSIYNVAGGNPTIDPNVNFDTVGPSSGTTPSTIDDSITVNSQGVYTVTFTIELRASSGGISNNIIFRLSINGTPLATKQIEYQTFVTAANIEVDLVSRTDQLALNQGDVIRVAIVSSTGVITYDNLCIGSNKSCIG